jgi:hypothetical protein
MKKSILIASLDHRSRCAQEFQKVLTRFGCHIKTRLGIHDGVLTQCSDRGLIILELVGSSVQISDFSRTLKAIPGVKVKTVSI